MNRTQLGAGSRSPYPGPPGHPPHPSTRTPPSPRRQGISQEGTSQGPPPGWCDPPPFLRNRAFPLRQAQRRAGPHQGQPGELPACPMGPGAPCLPPPSQEPMSHLTCAPPPSPDSAFLSNHSQGPRQGPDQVPGSGSAVPIEAERQCPGWSELQPGGPWCCGHCAQPAGSPWLGLGSWRGDGQQQLRPPSSWTQCSQQRRTALAGAM